MFMLIKLVIEGTDVSFVDIPNRCGISGVTIHVTSSSTPCIVPISTLVFDKNSRQQPINDEKCLLCWCQSSAYIEILSPGVIKMLLSFLLPSLMNRRPQRLLS